jgi:hypothetical protein
MFVSSKIDQLIESLSALKPLLSENNTQNLEEFNKILLENIKTSTDEPFSDENVTSNVNVQLRNNDETKKVGVPQWVDKNFPYDPLKPRNPTTRELSAALAGITPEASYSATLIGDKAYNQTQHTSREIMFGVIGTNTDTRDWQKIMSSPNVLEAARSETNKMYGPVVKIVSDESSAGNIQRQYPILEDRNGKGLIVLTHPAAIVEEKLLNFGATSQSIPDNIASFKDEGKLDSATLEMLTSFDNKQASLHAVVLQNTSEAIANKLSQEIPLGELAKL